LRERRGDAYRRLELMLYDERYVKLLDRVVSAAERPAFNRRAAPARFPHERTDHAQSVSRKAVKELGEPPPDRDCTASAKRRTF
jgi:hypothetical protein